MSADEIEEVLKAVIDVTSEAAGEAVDPQDGQAFGECTLALRKAIKHLEKRTK